MVVNFANLDLSERPTLILRNAGGTPLGVLGYAKNVSPDLKYNEVSTIEFELPSQVDGAAVPFYEDVVGMRIVEYKGIGQFVLVNPAESGDGVQKQKTCKGYSLEYEFARKKISIPEGTYKFWDTASTGNTLLEMIMEQMPAWSVGTISESLFSRYRTFEISNENIYNFIKGTVQESYNCIFYFDTLTRTVHVRDADENPSCTPVYISTDNLATSIDVEENTENIVTRLDVNGAEGVDIRDVNPCGTNKIINLDYYMTTSNFEQALIDKYFAWKQLCEDNRQSFYSLSVQYSLKTSQKVAEQAKLADLKNEMTGLENIQAVTIQAIAQKLSTQEDLDKVNTRIEEKRVEIVVQENVISDITDSQANIFEQLTAIRNACSFEKYFAPDELLELDKYIKDDELSESSFVVSTVTNYTNEATGSAADGKILTITGAEITAVTNAAGIDIYAIKGGEISFNSDNLTASVISATFEQNTDGTFVFSAYLGAGKLKGNAFPSACASFTGEAPEFTHTETSFSAPIVHGYFYFTLDATEYEKRSVAWDLYEYGEMVLQRLAAPTYTFSITSANFLSLEEFTSFKNSITLGERIYVGKDDDTVLTPIFTGIKYNCDELESLELEFSDSYSSSDNAFRLVDLLDKSISMGKNVELSKYIYSSFIDSGAETGIRQFMTSALDVAKNAVLSSSEQAISWDGAGFRMRRWANEAHTAYENEQIWMINNSIVMTDDNWATAKMAIGKFHDDNLGDCWGIVAPRIVGTLLAGESLIIESAKKDGGTSVFRVDGDGCHLFNSYFSVSNDHAHIVLNPSIGIAIGTYPVVSADDAGNVTLNQDAANLWLDAEGNINIKGVLHAASGSFRGSVTATSLIIADGDSEKTINDYVGSHSSVTGAQQAAKDAADAAGDARKYAEAIFNGTTGIFFSNSSVGSVIINKENGLKITGTDSTYFQVMNNAMGFFDSAGQGLLYYENGNMVLKGVLHALGGYIGGTGGWVIGNQSIYNGSSSALGAPGGIYMGAEGISVGSAILMKPDGTFIIRGDNTSSSDTNYVMKIVPENVNGATVYRMHLGNIILDDSFMLPVANGGSGGDAASLVGIYRVTTTAAMNNLTKATNGDLCVLYSEGANGASVYGAMTQNTSTYPGYLSINMYGANGHHDCSYLGISNISYWNVASLSGDDVSWLYGRVGVGQTVGGCCGLFVPIAITIEGSTTGVTSATFKFIVNTRPDGCYRDLCYAWNGSIAIEVFKPGTNSSYTKIGSKTYILPSAWQTGTDTDRNAEVTIDFNTSVTSGEYYVVFHSRNVNSLMWIQPGSLSIPRTNIGAAAGIYLKTGGKWQAMMAIDG